MLLDLKNIEVTEVPNMLGGDGTTLLNRYMDDAGKIMFATLKPGCSIGMHTHSTSYEVCYCLSGNAKFVNGDGSEERMAPGLVHYCPFGQAHTCINDTDKDYVMYCVVANK